MKYHIYFFQLLPGQIAIRYRYNEVHKEKFTSVIFTDQILISIIRNVIDRISVSLFNFSDKNISPSFSILKIMSLRLFISNIIHSIILEIEEI